MRQAVEVELVCSDFGAALDLLRNSGLRLDVVYPADEPHTALLSRGTTRLRLTSNPRAAAPSRELPPFCPQFVLTRAGEQSRAGRAGMSYRDLIPGRLGGRYIASQITIEKAGRVSDWVHFHTIAFQLIVVRSGWVRLVYEDQGDPFVMSTGDLVVQPPSIRHRVLESSTGLEVIEISCPSLHETIADHELKLPNGTNPDRRFGDQSFLHHVGRSAPWAAAGRAEIQQTGVEKATCGLASARILRAGEGTELPFAPHAGELVFGFMLEGSAKLGFGGGMELKSSDAFVIPPGEPWSISATSHDFRLLEVMTPKLAASF